MENIKNTTNLFNKNIKDKLYDDYIKALKNDNFKKLVNRLKIKEEVGMNYTSKLEHVVECLKNCENCKNIIECKNDVTGCVYYPKVNEDKITFNYVTCKYKNKLLEEEKVNKSVFFGLSSDIKNAKMSDIDITDKKRVDVIKYLKKFYDNYPKDKKGLFLHGSFGCGKTYLISALFNEFAKKNYKPVIVYYPELLTKLKSSFDGDTSYSSLLEEIKTCDLLLLDDLGAEVVTSWSRDEILGTILQYRMDNHLSTFITSNLNIEEIENHLTLAKNNMDKVKARRIIERIKQLTVDYEMITKNRRN